MINDETNDEDQKKRLTFFNNNENMNKFISFVSFII